MRFVVDAQLPPALARWLTACGHQAEHVDDVGLASASDSDVWRHALACGAVIVTKDEDFSIRRGLASSGPQIVWIRLGNTTRAALLAWMEGVMPHVIDVLARGESIVEIR